MVFEVLASGATCSLFLQPSKSCHKISKNYDLGIGIARCG